MNPPRRWGFLFLAAMVALGGSAEAIRIAAVTTLAQSAEASDVERALAFDPGNPAVHNRLSQLYSESAGRTHLAAAVNEARRATALDPNITGYWRTLASACESAGDRACADQAFERALALSPMAPRVWWEAGNHYLLADRPAAALACFHRLLALSPEYATATFDVTLRASGDPNLILQKVVGDNGPQAALAFADFLSARNHFDAAHQAWTQAAGGSASFTFAAVQPYLERLLSAVRFEEAEAVWSQLEARRVIEKPAGAQPGNLMFNGSFEQTPLEAGFDWRAQPTSNASVDFADASPYAGARSLRVDFPVGNNDEFEPVYQFVPVTPNQAYTLTACVRSRDITSDSGPRLRVADPAGASGLDVSTETTVGTTEWHKVALSFTAGPQTRVVKVSVWRPRSRVFPMEISGSFWLDAVSLRAESR